MHRSHFVDFFFAAIPDRPVRPLRTGVDAALAADAFLLVDPPNVAIGSVHVTCAGGTVLDAERLTHCLQTDMTMSYGYLAKDGSSRMIWIRETEGFASPSCVIEQANMQLWHPKHRRLS